MSSEGGGWEWEAMVGELRLRPNILFWIEISKQLLSEGTEEDIRHVWEAVGCLIVDWEQFSRIGGHDGEESFERLMQVKGMSELEWEQSAFGEEDDDEEDEGEEEEEDEGDGGEDVGEEEDDLDEEELDAEQAQ